MTLPKDDLTNLISATERWVGVGRIGEYEVSDFGRVRKSSNQALRHGTLARSGYFVVNLYALGRSNVRNLHSIVAEAFIGPRPHGYVVVHLNGNRADNRAINLAYRPSRDAIMAPALAAGETRIAQKLTASEAQTVRRLALAGIAPEVLARRFSVSRVTISRIKLGKRWREVGIE